MAGYIGGTVLSRLLAHPDAPSLDITALLRSVDKAKKLEAFGVKSVVGSYEETALIEKLSEASHVVFTCVSCFYRILLRSADLLRFRTESVGQYGRSPSHSERIEAKASADRRCAYPHSHCKPSHTTSEVCRI